MVRGFGLMLIFFFFNVTATTEIYPLSLHDALPILYHIGNNGFHGYVYETALRHPGIVVMHESNLHHLIADLTIKRGDWDAYVRECEFEGGDRKSTRLNSSHVEISYAVFCLKKK